MKTGLLRTSMSWSMSASERAMHKLAGSHFRLRRATMPNLIIELLTFCIFHHFSLPLSSSLSNFLILPRLSDDTHSIDDGPVLDESGTFPGHTASHDPFSTTDYVVATTLPSATLHSPMLSHRRIPTHLTMITRNIAWVCVHP